MKATTLLFSLLVSTTIAFSQTAPVSVIETKGACAAVTQRIMDQSYSLDKQLALQASPEQLGCIDYLFAHSYKFTDGQMALKSQKILFNVNKYEHMRKKDYRVTIYDDQSGLKVELYSWNEVDQAIGNIKVQYQLAACYKEENM